jgi:hypothetical protein
MKTVRDPIAGVPVTRITSGKGVHLLPYYTADAVSADGSLLACTYDGGTGDHQAWVYSLSTGEGRRVSSVPGGIMEESVVFHRSRPCLCFASPHLLYAHDLATGQTEELFHTADGFEIKSEISLGREHAVFQVYEVIDPGRGRTGDPIPSFQTLQQCRSYILAVHLTTGAASVVWSAIGHLAHPVISPVDDNRVLYANQGSHERLQELFTVARVERDNRQPRKLYHAVPQRPVYVGHSFFTEDGWVGTQLIEFGGEQPDGRFADMVGCNAVIKPDGTCDRRVRCPGGNKPMHVHAARADGWWVGDAFTEEGRSDLHTLCLMKNNWETGYCQSEPLLAHGCNMERPCHVHARFIRGESALLFNSNYTGDCHIYLAEIGEFTAGWKNRVPFEPRPSRYCYPPPEVRLNPKRGPAL